MKLESRMSIGYMKGKWWVPDEVYQSYTEWPEYKALFPALRKARPGGVAFNCTYSYTSRLYMAEIKTIERFEKSAQLYFISHNNCYEANPMAAVSRAIRESDFCTPLLAVLCLELELRILLEVTSKARASEDRAERMFAWAIDDLSAALNMLYV